VTVDLAVVGAIALDEIHSQAGDIDQLLGGSAVYASLAASMLSRAAPISVVGDDFVMGLLDPLIDRGVSLDGIEHTVGPNFRWGCRYSSDGDVRETLYTRAGVYDTYPIVVDHSIRRAPYVLLTAGNPNQNHRAMTQMIEPTLVAIDTIEREVAERREEFREQLRYADIVSINTLEAAHLVQWQGEQTDPGLPAAAWSEIRSLGPSVFIHKKASQGVEIFQEGLLTRVSAVPDIKVVDPTGAGDTFIGALLSAVSRGCDLVEGAVWGCAAASFAIEQFGIEGICSATCDSVADRTSLITIDGAPAATPFLSSR